MPTIHRNTEKPAPLTFEQKIWEVVYMVRLHAFDSRTLEDVQQNGVMITGIPDLDEGMKNDWVKRFVTISQMVNFFKRGVSFKLVQPEQSREIYEVVEDYLVRCIDVLKTGMNLGDAPLEDFMAMDTMAHKLYGHAKHYDNAKALESLWASRLAMIQPIHMGNLFVTPGPTQTPEEIAEANKAPERAGFAQDLRNSAMALRRAQP